jgi:hypothetical protein
VSTARGGESSAFEPGLDHLIGALTASGHPHELAGRDAARAAFHAASQQPAPARPSRRESIRSAWRRRPVRVALPARLAVAIAAIAAVLGGFTAAAAAQVLPAPVQQIAYNVLAPLGVPVSQPAPSHGQSSAPGSRSSGPGPSASNGGCPCPSTSASATGTGPAHHQRARKANAKAKKPLAEPVLRLISGRLKDHLNVAAHSGKPGDIVNLTESTTAGWITITSAPLGPKLHAFFVLPVSTAAGHLFKAEVLEGTPRGTVASNSVWIPRPAKTGAKAIQPTPSTSLAATGTTAPTPTPSPTPTLTSSSAPATSPDPTASPSSSPSPTPTLDPSTTAPSGTASPAPTASPDPSASASVSAASGPQEQEPSSSSPGHRRSAGGRQQRFTGGLGGAWRWTGPRE